MTLEKACKSLIIKFPFYGIFLLGLNKHYGTLCSTACVYKQGIHCALCVNEEYWNTLSDEMQLAVLIHEINHILFKHLWNNEQFTNHDVDNFAADCEVNSYIPTLQKPPYIYPALFNWDNELGRLTYYQKLLELGKKGLESGECVDDHSTWSSFADMSEAETKIVSNQIDERAKATAEAVTKSRGAIPRQFAEYIKALLHPEPPIFNWKAHFRRILGNTISTSVVPTRMRPSKRFAQAQGFKSQRKTSVLVGVDTSGSVSNDELQEFFQEIYHIWKAGVNVTVAECDTGIGAVFQYKGQQDIQLTGRGGTILSPLFDLYKANKQYSSLVIFTDGYISDSDKIKMKNVIWVITSSGRQGDTYPGIQINIPVNRNNK